MSRIIPIQYHLIYLCRVRTMNDFLCKSVQYTGSGKGWPRKRKSVERYGGSRWYKEWFGAHTFLNSSSSERSIRPSMVITQSTYPNRLRRLKLLQKAKIRGLVALQWTSSVKTGNAASILQWCATVSTTALIIRTNFRTVRNVVVSILSFCIRYDTTR